MHSTPRCGFGRMRMQIGVSCPGGSSRGVPGEFPYTFRADCKYQVISSVAALVLCVCSKEIWWILGQKWLPMQILQHHFYCWLFFLCTLTISYNIMQAKLRTYRGLNIIISLNNHYLSLYFKRPPTFHSWASTRASSVDSTTRNRSKGTAILSVSARFCKVEV